MKYRDVQRRLTALGCEEVARRSGGSHRKWRHLATGRATVVPDWGAKDLKLGTIRALVRQLGIAWEDFDCA